MADLTAKEVTEGKTQPENTKTVTTKDANKKPVTVVTKEVPKPGTYAGGLKHPKDYTEEEKASFPSSGFPRSAPLSTGTMALTPDDQAFVEQQKKDKLKDAAEDTKKAQIKTENAENAA